MNYKITAPTQIPSMMETLNANLVGLKPESDYRLSSLSIDRSSFVNTIFRVSIVVTFLNEENIDERVKVIAFEWDIDPMILSCNGDEDRSSYQEAGEFLNGLIDLSPINPQLPEPKFKH